MEAIDGTAVFRLPKTRRTIDVGVTTEIGTLLRIKSETLRARCPACGQMHEWKVGEAALRRETPRRPDSCGKTTREFRHRGGGTEHGQHHQRQNAADHHGTASVVRAGTRRESLRAALGEDRRGCAASASRTRSISAISRIS
jgi:hypothetical protein